MGNATYRFAGGALSVARMGFGAMQLPGPEVWGPPRDKNTALAVLRTAVELGVNHIDTSDFYGPHVSNQLIREALSPYPDGLVIITKVGFARTADKSWVPARQKAELVAAVMDNLRHLGLDVLDVVNLRVGDAFGRTEDSIVEPLEALAELQQKGLIRHIGLSNVSHGQYREGTSIAKIVCVQNLYNVANRQDDALIDELAADGIAYTPFFPLGGVSPLQSAALSDVAREMSVTPMQVALAWLLQRSPNILLIPGTSSLVHLKENVTAAKIVLPAKALDALNGIGAIPE
ncbi:oxidoreductase [Ochrobactrum oryzae]|uniref:oxidoreductase n=1 Tax=Brucella oryzae TaxID=335286 RepID=UPI0016B60BC5|nr:oxidoreductase [Brucella oryzae]